ncbi:MAG TPA: peptidylprolyl isomerase [bacterium (Candidatus Stahlbacteria)]|nr:peptidylprolyl isomerase [Candidatus Stahlbacteria bacterium]
MVQAKNGDTVKVHYTGRLEDGSVFDSSLEREPLEFILGSGKLITGFETAILGMSPGEKKTIRINPDQAYGPYREDLVATVLRSEFPPSIIPKTGMELIFRQPDGGSLRVKITEVTDDQITLDGNHPLAGKVLTFDIELIEIL